MTQSPFPTPDNSVPASTHLDKAVQAFGGEILELFEQEDRDSKDAFKDGSDLDSIDPVEQLLMRYGDRLHDDSRLAYAGKIALACREAAINNQDIHSRYMIFALGEQRFAVPLAAIKEVAGQKTVTRLPRTHKWLKGIVVLRGQIVSVTDLAKFFGLQSNDCGLGKLVVVQTNHQNAITALSVDRIHGIRTIPRGSLRPCPAGLSACKFLSGIAHIEDAVVVLLEPNQMFVCPELANYMH